MTNEQVIDSSFMHSTKIECRNCKSEYLKKDLKEKHHCTDIDDGYTECWYTCPTCNSIIVVYFV